MKIAVTGASGLIGSALVPHLRARGDDVLRLVRRTAVAPDEVQWDPVAGSVDLDALAGVDAVVHLAGAGVGDRRWTDDYKKTILDSRVDGTRTVVDAMTRLDPRPRALVAGSAIGWYGDTGDRAVDESAPAGTGFLADVVRAWEAAADPAREAGIRVTHARTGLVVSSKGGAWQRLFPIFKAGLGGKLGSGRQYWSWISLRDEVAALTFLLDNEEIAGPVNLTGPQPVTNAEVTEVMGRVLRRPTVFAVPSFALKTVLGEFSSEVLGSTRVLPSVLTDAGFSWQDSTVESAIRAAVN
ncbi:MAG TPA: TIGR01777 family oxidoreductase [Candidatus Nanopelagicales bacterium]|nr:TIGR01777 family oxidoreductase [Candidatus Nanopelagicales bacterium]